MPDPAPLNLAPIEALLRELDAHRTQISAPHTGHALAVNTLRATAAAIELAERVPDLVAEIVELNYQLSVARDHRDRLIEMVENTDAENKRLRHRAAEADRIGFRPAGQLLVPAAMIPAAPGEPPPPPVVDEDSAPTIEAQIQEIRDRLRELGVYDVKLTIGSSAGFLYVEIDRAGGYVDSNDGQNLADRLSWAIERLREIGDAQ